MLLGVHVSTAGGLPEAVKRAQKVGCETFQIFTSNPKGWQFNIRSEEEIAEFKNSAKAADINTIFGHLIYLANLASNNPYIYENSVNSLISALVLAEKAGFAGVITHIGSHGGRGSEDGVKRVSEALKQALLSTKTNVPIILETDAGPGAHMGASFAEIGQIIKAVGSDDIKVCLDTCHVYAAGYDVATDEGLEKTLAEFNAEIGLDRLVVLHLNDSKGTLGSHLDRHEEIGKGEIGLEAFERIINHPKLKDLPGIVETPDNKDTFEAEKLSIDILKELRR
jgi:deoxyribonuclease IV